MTDLHEMFEKVKEQENQEQNRLAEIAEISRLKLKFEKDRICFESTKKDDKPNPTIDESPF